MLWNSNRVFDVNRSWPVATALVRIVTPFFVRGRRVNFRTAGAWSTVVAKARRQRIHGPHGSRRRGAFIDEGSVELKRSAVHPDET